ncbi:MAG: gliding motility-associated C-terminal domain-containing protein [Flavobacteriales bacterium]|nr:gliding motility-associated C-terminal domain-containing protein [Flavobacteriales bacterium]
MKQLKLYIFLLATLFISVNYYSQLTANGASTSTSTSYTNGATNDVIYIYCSTPTNPVTGSLTATPPSGTGPFSFSWYSYDSGPNNWSPLSNSVGATSTINNLASGGYLVSILDNAGNPVGCYRAWIFVNETQVDAGAPVNGCSAFSLTATPNAMANFVYYNPPPNPLLINANTQISVCFNATHTYVSDLGFFLISPNGTVVTLSPNPGANGQGSVCNSGNDVSGLCFSNTTSANFDPCAASAPYQGNYTSYGPAGGTTPINWASLYGEDATQGGWAVQIYDCIGADVGSLTGATISFSGPSNCGNINVNYTSGAINSAINDNSCTAATASIFQVPQNPSITTPITLNNSISSIAWSTGATTATTNIATPPSGTQMYYVTVTDNFGCTATDSVQFTNTCSCNIDYFEANIGAPNCTTGTFDITGEVQYTNAPSSGSLIIENCSGDQVTYTYPFPASPINYTIAGITADGTPNCDVTVYFTADAACTQTVGPYTEPQCDCFFTSISVNIGLCDPNTNDFSITGSVGFDTPPATGNLVIEDCNGNQVTYPVGSISSPHNFTLSGINSDGTTNCSITAYFSADAACFIESPNYDNPASCACAADVGTFNSSITGNGTTTSPFLLCFNDQINIISNNNMNPPEDFSPLTDGFGNPITYDPGIAYAVYECPPTVTAPDPLGDDPCLLGVIFPTSGSDFVDINDLGDVPWAGNFTNSTVYYVPITTYSSTDGYYAISINGGDWCYDMGNTYAVQYLPEITSTINPNCVNGTATVTLNGGSPELNGTQFTASNLLPATASFNNTTCGNGGTIVVSGLQNGDMYSFDVEDENGCPITVSGGPFVGLPTADAGPDGQSCTLTYNLSATPSFGTGTWTGTGTFSNASSPTSTVTVSAAGSYTFTWTENNGAGCTDADQVIVQFSNLQYTQVVNNSTCGNADGSITLSGNSGIPAYSYSIDNGTTTQASGSFTGLGAGTYNILVEDNIGCQETGTISITDVGGPTINSINGNDISCNAACDGDIAISATGATQFSINNGVSFQAGNTFSALCAGVYDIVVQDALGCSENGTITLAEPDALVISTTQVNLLCANQCNGQISITTTGGTAPFQFSIDNGATNQAAGTFTNLCGGTYAVRVIDAGGCIATTNVTITEPTPISVTIGITDATCFGMCNGMMNSIPAGGTGAGTYSYSWSPAVGGNVPLVTNLCAGSYNLSITDGNGCVLDTNGIVVGAPAPVTINSVTSTNETCAGDCDGTVTINATGASQYSINGTTYTGSNVFNNLCAGNYTVYAQDINGCGGTDVVTVLGPTPVTVLANGTTTICMGQSTPLTAVGAGGVGSYTYSWDNGAGTQNTNVSPTNTQTYCVTATDANGCASPASCVNVTVNPPLNVIAVASQSICEGESAQITAIGSGGNGGPYTYTWDQGVGIGQTQSVSPAFTTIYNVTLSDGCTTPNATSSLTITVNTVPNISFSADNLDGCAPVQTNFTEINVPAGSTCLWSFGDGGATTDCSNVSYSFNNPGCWDVTLSITTPEGCQSSSTIADYICAYDYPNPEFTFGPQPTTILEPTISFFNFTGGTNNYVWTFDTNGDQAQSTQVNPSYTFGDVGTYEVCLEATSLEGCPSVVCDTVVILEEFIVYVPNAFTPDDDGVNDGFAPIITGIMPNTYEFMVFNRWGELIYQSQIIGAPWDGTYKNVMSQEDVYVWKLKVDDQTGETHEYIGHVTLIK